MPLLLFSVLYCYILNKSLFLFFYFINLVFVPLPHPFHCGRKELASTEDISLAPQLGTLPAPLVLRSCDSDQYSPSLLLYNTPPSSLPSHLCLFSPQQNSTGRFKNRIAWWDIYICFTGSGQSYRWVGRSGDDEGLRYIRTQKLCNVHCRQCGQPLQINTPTLWLLAIPSRHHIETQQECVTDPHSEREGWQDGYGNMHSISCVLCKWTWIKTVHLPQTHSSAFSSLIEPLLPFFLYIYP